MVVISDDEECDSDVVLVESTIDKKEDCDSSGFLADSSVSSFSFGSPPDHTEYLKLLYSGQGALLPESMRPPFK